MRDPLERIHWVVKHDDEKLCIVGYDGQRTDWKVQHPIDARDAAEAVVRTGILPPK